LRPKNILLAINTQFFEKTKARQASSLKALGANALPAGVLHRQLDAATGIGPHQVHPHKTALAGQVLLRCVGGGGIGFRGGGDECAAFVIFDHRQAACAIGHIAVHTRYLQGEKFAFFTGGIIQQFHSNNFFLFAHSKRQVCRLVYVIPPRQCAAITGNVGKHSGGTRRFVQAHSEVNPAGIFRLTGADHLGRVNQWVYK
jgi:hypothetical protein